MIGERRCRSPEAELAGEGGAALEEHGVAGLEVPVGDLLEALEGATGGGAGVGVRPWARGSRCGAGGGGVCVHGQPIFARGLSPLDTFARAIVTGIGVEARVGGVDVRPGDLVVADFDGIVVVPQEIVEAVAEAVVTKHRLEGNARDDLLAGKSIREVWTKYGVL